VRAEIRITDAITEAGPVPEIVSPIETGEEAEEAGN